MKSDHQFEVDVEFKFISEPDLSHGLAIFFLDQQPVFPGEFHDEFGYRTDYKGLGVFLYRSESKGKWVSNMVFPYIDIFWLIVHFNCIKQRFAKHHKVQKPRLADK